MIRNSSFLRGRSFKFFIFVSYDRKTNFKSHWRQNVTHREIERQKLCFYRRYPCLITMKTTDLDVIFDECGKFYSHYWNSKQKLLCNCFHRIRWSQFASCLFVHFRNFLHRTGYKTTQFIEKKSRQVKNKLCCRQHLTKSFALPQCQRQAVILFTGTIITVKFKSLHIRWWFTLNAASRSLKYF